MSAQRNKPAVRAMTGSLAFDGAAGNAFRSLIRMCLAIAFMSRARSISGPCRKRGGFERDYRSPADRRVQPAR
jgi:hypothetical protein